MRPVLPAVAVILLLVPLPVRAGDVSPPTTPGHGTSSDLLPPLPDAGAGPRAGRLKPRWKGLIGGTSLGLTAGILGYVLTGPHVESLVSPASGGGRRDPNAFDDSGSLSGGGVVALTVSGGSIGWLLGRHAEKSHVPAPHHVPRMEESIAQALEQGRARVRAARGTHTSGS